MIAEFALNERQAEAILNMRLRQLAAARGVRDRQGARRAGQGARGAGGAGREPGQAAQPAEEGSGARWRRLMPSDERRTMLKESGPARELDWSQMIEKEPITVILSQRGWIRALRGHVALAEVAEMKWREGDGPHLALPRADDRQVAGDGRQWAGLYARRGQVARRARVRRAAAADDRPRGRGRGDRDDGGAGRHAAAGGDERRARLRDQRRGGDGRDAQGQATGQSAAGGEGRAAAQGRGRAPTRSR